MGIATGDDAGVYRITPEIALVQTLDFFTPIVDDPYLFGQIAAANSLSDIYAMGGTPITAMNILCYPIKDRDINELGAILRGGADKIAEAGVALVGGHSVEDAEPKYGLSVTGTVHPEHVTTNAGAKPGDVIVLTKPLGTGIITTAAKFEACPPEVLAAACASMATLNKGAAEAMREVGIGLDGVHAATDITGFGLSGHLWQLAKASGLRIELDSASLPLFDEVEGLAAEGNLTRGERLNRDYLGEALTWSPDVSPTRQSVVVDPQTSGGLAIFVAEDRAGELIALLGAAGTLCSAVIGRAVSGQAGIHVR